MLVVAKPQRLAILPGVPSFEAYDWQGFFGPIHLSFALTERLYKSLATALRVPKPVPNSNRSAYSPWR